MYIYEELPDESRVKSVLLDFFRNLFTESVFRLKISRFADISVDMAPAIICH